MTSWEQIIAVLFFCLSSLLIVFMYLYMNSSGQLPNFFIRVLMIWRIFNLPIRTPTVARFLKLVPNNRRSKILYDNRCGLPRKWFVPLTDLFSGIFVSANIDPADIAGVIAIGSAVYRKWLKVSTDLGRWDHKPKRKPIPPGDIDILVICKRAFQEVFPTREQAVSLVHEYSGSSVVRTKCGLHLVGVSSSSIQWTPYVETGYLIFGDTNAVYQQMGVYPRRAKWRWSLLFSYMCLVPVRFRDMPEKSEEVPLVCPFCGNSGKLAIK